MTGALQAMQKAIDTEQLLALQQAADEVYVDPALIEYAVKVVSATRDPEMVGQGELSPYLTYSGPVRALRSISSSPAGRSPLCAAGRMPCHKMCATWPLM